jgi:phospholipid/cholesterol/gamma-HCH transport system substrate-binding protein
VADSGSGQTASGTTAQPSSTGGTASAGGDTVMLGDYDPLTGNVIAADGRRLTIGSTAGAQQVFGNESWTWLLLGPLSQ